MTFDKAYNEHKREQKRKQLVEKAKQSKELPEGISLIQGDFRIAGQSIKDNSIDHIFVDPLYFKENLEDFRDLAILAERVLKPHRSIILYVPTALIPEVISYFHNAGLRYHWEISAELQGPFARAHGGKVRITHKPLLWFRKGDKVIIDYEMHDSIKSQRPPKDMMDWEQSVIEAGHVIKALTVENEIVLDPMMGSGTAGLVSKKLKRKFIGIENNPETFEIAKANLSMNSACNKLS